MGPEKTPAIPAFLFCCSLTGLFVCMGTASHYGAQANFRFPVVPCLSIPSAGVPGVSHHDLLFLSHFWDGVPHTTSAGPGKISQSTVGQTHWLPPFLLLFTLFPGGIYPNNLPLSLHQAEHIPFSCPDTAKLTKQLFHQ